MKVPGRTDRNHWGSVDVQKYKDLLKTNKTRFTKFNPTKSHSDDEFLNNPKHLLQCCAENMRKWFPSKPEEEIQILGRKLCEHMKSRPDVVSKINGKTPSDPVTPLDVLEFLSPDDIKLLVEIHLLPKSKADKKREQRKRRKERKRNEAILEAKNAAENGNGGDKESSKSGISNGNQDDVEPESSKSADSNLDSFQDRDELYKLLNTLAREKHLATYETIEGIMLRQPLTIPHMMSACVEKNRERIKLKDCEVFMATVLNYWELLLKRLSPLDPKSATDREEIRRRCPSVFVLYHTYYELMEAKIKHKGMFYNEKLLFNIENAHRYFNLHRLPTADEMREMTKAAPATVLKHLTKLLIAEDGSEYLESKQLTEYQWVRNTLLPHSLELNKKVYDDEKKEKELHETIIGEIALLYLCLKIFVETAKREFYEKEEPQRVITAHNIPTRVKMDWLVERDEKKVLEIFLAHEQLKNTEIGMEIMRPLFERPEFLQKAKNRADLLQLLKVVPWENFTTQQKLIMKDCNLVISDLYEVYLDKLHKTGEEPAPDSVNCQSPSDEKFSLEFGLHKKKFSDEKMECSSKTDSGIKVNQNSINSRQEIVGSTVTKFADEFDKGLKTLEEPPKSQEKPKEIKTSPEVHQKAESSSNELEALKESKNRKRKEIKKPSPETLAALSMMVNKESTKNKTENHSTAKSDDSDCVNCIELKNQYRQEQNNRTIAEGELKRAAHKIKGYDILKKEEENWKVEKKRMEKEMRRLRENKDNEIKELREEIEKLKESNKSMEEHRKNTFELYLETKKSLQETTRSFESLRDSTIIINMETKRVLEENRQLNGPYTLKYSSPEHKLKVFKELKEKFNPTETIEKVHTMAEIFPEKSPEFEIALETEQKRVETSSDIYSRILDYNLKLIEDTNCTTGLLPVPFPPTVSEQFEKIFKKGLEKLEGKECYVCFKRLETAEKIYACAEFHKHIVCFECGNNMIVQWKGKCGFCPGVLNESTYDVSMDE